MIYYENIVNVALYFFYSSLDFRTTFISSPPPPLFSSCHCHNCYKKFFPYFGNGIATISLSQFFFFSFHFGNSTHATHPVSRNWVEEFRYSHYRNSTFSLSFFFFSLILFVEFRQWWYQNSLSFLTILNNFQQFL